VSNAKDNDEAEVKSDESKPESAEADTGAEAGTEPEAKAESTEKAKAESGAADDAKASSGDGGSSDEDSEEGDSEGDDVEQDEAVQAKPAEKVAEPAKVSAPPPPEDLGPEPPPERDSPKMGMITVAFVVIAAVLIGLVVGTRELFHGVFRAEIQRKVGDPVSESLTKLRAMEERRLGSYQWIDQERGSVRIPTSRASELVLAKYAAMPIEKPAAPAPAPAPEAPAPAPAPEGSAAPEAAPAPEGSAAAPPIMTAAPIAPSPEAPQP
jgi:hypothetical protein